MKPINWLVLLACSMAPVALAQDDLGLGEPAPHSSAAEAEAGAVLSWFLDGQARYERTTDIPGRADDIDRTRLRLRGGLVWTGPAGLEIGAVLEAQAASSDNRDTRRNNDNERSDQLLLDQLYLRYPFSDSAALLLGKSVMPLTLTPMLWDADLRPIGASVAYHGSVADFDAWHFDLGYFAPDHLYDDDSRLAALQLGYGWNEGAPTSATLLASYLAFDDLEKLVEQGLGRNNRRIAIGGVPTLVSDYELLDLLLIARTSVFERPLEVQLDYVRNLGADDQDEGARGSVQLGDAMAGGWELGFSYQRIQRDAVPAAFNDDDWWFHGFARGGMPWLAYGWSGHWRVRLAGFRERRDGIADSTDRVLLDVHTNW